MLYPSATTYPSGTTIPFAALLRYENISIDYGSELFYNRASIARVGGDPQIRNNTDSQAAYGISSLELNGLLLNNDWRPFNTSYNTEISYSGAYNSSFTVTTNVPTNARYILADVFVTVNISDHLNIELGNTALANPQAPLTEPTKFLFERGH